MMVRGNFLMDWNTGNYVFLNMDYISEQSLCLHDLGLEKRQNEIYDYQNTNRDMQCYIFQYTLDGYGIFETKGRSYTMTKGKAFFIHLPDESRYYLPEPDNSENQWTLFYLNFSGPAVEPFFKRIQELSGSVVSLELVSPAIQQFLELFEALKNGKQFTRYEGSEWLYRFLTALLRNIEFPSDKKNSPHVEAAMEWMQEHYALQQNLDAMSREIGISFSHLTRQFYKEQGITPIQYLTYIRLEHAMHLMINTNITIEKIAEKCGYSCGNYFSKVFRKVLHISPAEYRKLHKTNN